MMQCGVGVCKELLYCLADNFLCKYSILRSCKKNSYKIGHLFTRVGRCLSLLNDAPFLEGRSSDIEKFWKEAYNDFKQIYKDDTLARHYATDVLYDMNVFKVEGR